jgi:hypothetical protein
MIEVEVDVVVTVEEEKLSLASSYAHLCLAVIGSSPAKQPLRTAEDTLPTERVSILSTPKKQLNHLAQGAIKQRVFLP